MTLARIKELLQAEFLAKHDDQGIDIEFAKASDLMSDVLAFSQPGALLLTGLTNNQVIRTCEIAGICAVVFVRGKNPSAETIQLAQTCNIPILSTQLSMFEACGILFSNGMLGISNKDGA